MAFSAKIVGDELVLRIPLNGKPEKSSSGKTLVGVNAYIPTKQGRRHASEPSILTWW